MNEQAVTIAGRVNILRQALSSDKNKVAFLLGAGCPLSMRNEKGEPLIPDIAGLTENVCVSLKSEKIEQLKQGIPLPEGKEATVEDILSRVRLLIDVVGDEEFNGFSKQTLISLEKKICEEITKSVNKELPKEITPYHNLASWITGIPRENPIEIFTPNFVLLIESTLESTKIPYFYGFVGSRNAFFDLYSMEHEILPSRWVKLWKLHGSINWWNKKDGTVFRGSHCDGDENTQMIYPSHLKYSQSRRMPYLAMQDRLSKFLSKGQSVLIICGYSFVDQHLNEIIMQRLLANPRAVCFGLLYSDIENYSEALECASKTTNLNLISKNAAFFAGEKTLWAEEEVTGHYDYLIESDGDVPNCKLGDFAVFSKFLLKQTGDQLMEIENEG